MKSFGVRLAAGAGTILVVAYAIALAQKDKQAVSDSWNAETTVAADPAVPIPSGEADNWLEQPDSKITDEQTALLFAKPSSAFQQVDHSEAEDAEPAIQNAVFAPPSSTEDQPTVLATPELPNPTTATAALALAAGEAGIAASGIAADAALALPTFATGTETQATPDVGESVLGGDFEAGAAVTNPAFPSPVPAVADVPTSTDGLAPTAAGLGFPNTPRDPADVFPPSNPAPPTLAGTAPTNALRSEPGPNLLRAAAPVAGVASAFAEPTLSAGAAQPQSDVATPNLAAGVQSHNPNATVNPLVLSGGTVMVAPSASSPFHPSHAPTDPVTQPGIGVPSGTGVPTRASGASHSPLGMVPPHAAIALDPNTTIDAPGERRLEGIQTPSVIIQKRAPAEVKVGKPASFVIHVRNVGSVEALDVEVHDRVPAGMRLVDASPRPQMQGNLLMWQIGSMPAGDERTITLQLIPEQEGELGSVARVSFEAAASVRTIATRPVLNIQQQAPEKVLIGQQLEIGLQISNSGSGQATNVEIWEDVPEGLSHPEGPQLKHSLGTLLPGEVRTDSLFLKAEKAGIIQNTISLIGDDGLKTDHTVAVQVIAPDLQVSLEGPSRRFLERQAKYQLNVANAGTADATNVEISVQLSRGFTFVSTDYEGQYDASRHAVFWSLAQLPAGANGAVPLTLLPVEAGEQTIRINAQADLNTTVQSERKMTVEGFADLGFSITNPQGPIEIGAETTYEITVNNSGSKPDTNVRVQLMIPAGLELISVDGEAGTDGNGLVAFEPRPQLAPGQEFKYRLRVRGTTAGTHIVKAVVVSDHSTVPVTKEDSTRVYADQ